MRLRRVTGAAFSHSLTSLEYHAIFPAYTIKICKKGKEPV